jgi:hypothetical protein
MAISLMLLLLVNVVQSSCIFFGVGSIAAWADKPAVRIIAAMSEWRSA